MENSFVLFGHKGSGKSYWGSHLAGVLGWEFIDTDRLIEKECGGLLTCREIFLQRGEEEFRQIEKRVIFRLEKKENVIIAVGGGAVLDEQVLRHLQGLGQMVYMKVRKEVLKKRLLGGSVLPSFLNPLDPEKSFEKMYEARASVYEKIEGKIWFLPLHQRRHGAKNGLWISSRLKSKLSASVVE